jgi:hypothetical protein
MKIPLFIFCFSFIKLRGLHLLTIEIYNNGGIIKIEIKIKLYNKKPSRVLYIQVILSILKTIYRIKNIVYCNKIYIIRLNFLLPINYLTNSDN